MLTLIAGNVTCYIWRYGQKWSFKVDGLKFDGTRCNSKYINMYLTLLVVKPTINLNSTATILAIHIHIHKTLFTFSALTSFSFSEAILSSSYILTGSCNDLPDAVIDIALLLPLQRAVECQDNNIIMWWTMYCGLQWNLS